MRESWKLEVSVSYFSPTCSSEEKADQNCYVQEMKTFCLSPVLSSVNWWTHLGALSYFLRAKLPGDICESSIITFWTSVFAVVIDTPLHALHILNLLLHPLMGYKWLFIPYHMSVNTHVTVRSVTVRNITVTNSDKSQFNNIASI